MCLQLEDFYEVSPLFSLLIACISSHQFRNWLGNYHPTITMSSVLNGLWIIFVCIWLLHNSVVNRTSFSHHILFHILGLNFNWNGIVDDAFKIQMSRQGKMGEVDRNGGDLMSRATKSMVGSSGSAVRGNCTPHAYEEGDVRLTGVTTTGQADRHGRQLGRACPKREIAVSSPLLNTQLHSEPTLID